MAGRKNNQIPRRQRNLQFRYLEQAAQLNQAQAALIDAVRDRYKMVNLLAAIAYQEGGLEVEEWAVRATIGSALKVEPVEGQPKLRITCEPVEAQAVEATVLEA